MVYDFGLQSGLPPFLILKVLFKNKKIIFFFFKKKKKKKKKHY